MRGIPAPPKLTPDKPRRGQQRRRQPRQADPPLLTFAPPPPPAPTRRPLRRPPEIRQKLRARGRWGPSLLWCELPMVGAGAGAGTLAQPNQPRLPGPQPQEGGRGSAGGHRRRPQPRLGHAPRLCGHDRGGAGLAQLRQAPPPKTWRPAEPPCPVALGTAGPVQVGPAVARSPKPGTASEDCSGTKRTRGLAPDRRGSEPCRC